MAGIKLISFGGEMPSVSERALPATAARAAQNLYARTSEFLPLTEDQSTGVASGNPKYLHKFTRNATGGLATVSEGWLYSDTYSNFARGQLNGDFTERTFLSTPGGVSAPWVQTATGVSRQLGVPAPTVAPIATISEGEQFSVEDAIAAAPTMRAKIADAMKSAFVEQTGFGNSIPYVVPSGGNLGWLTHGASGVTAGPSSGKTLPSTNIYQWNLCIPINSGAVITAYAYLIDPAFSGNDITYGGNVYFAVPIRVSASVWLPYDVALTAALTALKRPDKNAAGVYEDLFLPAEVTSIVASSLAYWGYDAGSLSGPAKTAYEAAMTATKNLRLAIDNSSAPPSLTTTAYTTAKSNFLGASYAGAGPSLSTIFAWEAAWFSSEDGDYSGAGDVATHSRYWWPGNESTCFTNLVSDIESCITTTNGIVFDTGKMRGLVRTDFLLLIDQGTTNQQAVNMAKIEAALDQSMAGFVTFFGAANLKALGVGPVSDDSKKQALLTAIGEANTALVYLQALDEELYYQRQTAASNAYDLGPAARISAAGVTITRDTRYYFYTYVNDWGWESAPSPVSQLVEPDQNDKVWIEAEPPPSGRNIVGWRLYRSVSGSTASAFQLIYNLYGTTANVVRVKDLDGADTEVFDYLGIALRNGSNKMPYEDAPKPAENAAIVDEVCPSVTWLEPPVVKQNGVEVYLQGLTDGANGVMAGFIDNMFYCCEPYKPYAFPEKYRKTTKYPIVGIGSFGQTFFLGTRGNPYLASGSDSASISLLELPNPQACVASRSISSVETGVLYASPDGICLCDLGGVRVITEGLFTKKDWETLLGATPETTILGAAHDGVYYLGHAGGLYGIDYVANKLISITSTVPTSMYVDKSSDTLYYTSGGFIRAMFGSATKRTAVYKTGLVTFPRPEPLAWLQVFSDFSSAVTVKWYGDGVLRHTQAVTNTTPLRLPSGRYLEHQIEVSSAARVTSVILAGSTTELQSA